MKAIISRKVDGKYAEVGTMNRTIFKGRSFTAIRKRALQYANGQAFRIELFLDDDFMYGAPDEIRFYPETEAK